MRRQRVGPCIRAGKCHVTFSCPLACWKHFLVRSWWLHGYRIHAVLEEGSDGEGHRWGSD